MKNTFIQFLHSSEILPPKRILIISRLVGIIITILYFIVYDGQHTTTKASQSIVFYVSPAGSNTWSGRLKEPNSTRTDGPFATLDGARIALRRLLRPNPGSITGIPVIVYLRKGNYSLQKPILFDSDDSGLKGASITYEAFPGEVPILNGGQRVSTWKRLASASSSIVQAAKGKLWVADVSPGWRFNQLFLNDKRLTRSVTPNATEWEKWFSLSSFKNGRVIQFRPSLLRSIANLTDTEVNFLPSPSTHFVNFLSPIEAFDPIAGIITVTASSYFPATKGDSFRIENTLEGIDQPGEWSLDTQKGKVYLWPPKQFIQHNSTPYIDPNTVQIIAPRLNQGILMQGNEAQSKFVRNITIRGLTFKYFDRTRSDQPAPIGGHGTPDTNDAVITLVGVENILIDHNTIKNVGGVGIRNYLYAKGTQITNNRITNCGGAGIQLQGYPPGTHNVNLGHFISRNYIGNCGQIYWHSSGISTYMVADTNITGNHIEYMPYAGIYVGGIFTTFFRESKPTRSGAFRWNEIGNDPLTVESVKKFIPGNVTAENNTINNVMQVLDDGGAIYLAGSHNNIVRNNFIHNCPRPFSFGIYLDMDELNTTIENNIVSHCPNVSTNIGASLFLHVNGSTKVQNNIFIARSSRLYRLMGSYGNQFVSRNMFICEGNCVQGEVPEHKNVLGQSTNSMVPDLGPSTIDHNLYWSTDKGISAHKSLGLMRKKGFDNNSIAEDPGLIGFDKQGQFQFKFNFTASKIRFQKIKIKP
jgi:Right handed beta helix region